METPESFVNEAPYAALSDLVMVYHLQFEEMVAAQERMVAAMPSEFKAKLGVPYDPAGSRARAEEGLVELETAVSTRQMDQYLEVRRERVGELARAGLPYQLIARSITGLLNLLGEPALRAFPDEPIRGFHARDALGWLKSELLIVTGQAYADAREGSVEDAYQKTIRGLSTPAIQVWEGILVMPLIGVIDSARARQIMEQLLDRIVEHASKLVLLDVTGVPTIDSEVAAHLVRTTRAAHLVGAHTLLVGIGPQVAQTLVRLGVDLGGVETRTDLRSGLERAFEMLGMKVVTD